MMAAARLKLALVAIAFATALATKSEGHKKDTVAAAPPSVATPSPSAGASALADTASAAELEPASVRASRFLGKKLKDLAPGLIDPFLWRSSAPKSGANAIKRSKGGYGIESISSVADSTNDACQESCSFRGLCSKGICYCQPSYYGEHCEFENPYVDSAFKPQTVFYICIALAAISFGVSLLVLHCQSEKKQRALLLRHVRMPQ
eukprot:TRINITY_DN86726_c0_g1_i1.p1 TRINITY_DN86726_c0_g1~~TRINITY_DN86726_c0_g1_i1.p1  ORF type:complete len:205 (+),score=49.55 TRINITY_DN86726_c0_g1_i1:83-697(+)